VTLPETILGPTLRFSDRVHHYLLSRPRYPAALLRFCQDVLGLQSTDAIADLGSGTGFLSELFLQNGNPVFAVEPNAPMREAAEFHLAKYPNFHSIDARAEATRLPASSVRFVMAGQAFHWFDRPATRSEFQRILAEQGMVMLVWNERVLDGPHAAFARAYDEVVNEFATDLARVRHASITSQDSTALAEFFAPNAYKSAAFDNPHSLDLKGLEARAFSSSYLPLPGQPRADEMLQRIRAIFARFQNGGKVVQDYSTRVYHGQLPRVN
jgi:SAM-dependent methyltransferase